MLAFKKLTVALLYFFLALSITACNSSSSSTADINDSSSVSSDQDEHDKARQACEKALSDDLIAPQASDILRGTQEGGKFTLVNLSECRTLFVWQTIQYYATPARYPDLEVELTNAVDVLKELAPKQSIEFDIDAQSADWDRVIIVSLEGGYTYQYHPYTLFAGGSSIDVPMLSPVLLLDYNDDYTVRSDCCSQPANSGYIANYKSSGQCFSFDWLSTHEVEFQVSSDANNLMAFCEVGLWFEKSNGGFVAVPPVRYFAADTGKINFTVKSGTIKNGMYEILTINSL